MNKSFSKNGVKVDVQNCTVSIHGQVCPAVGLGTYRLTGKTCEKTVQEAIHLGYKIFDSATFYENLEAVGKGIQGHPREDLYIISKVWHNKLKRSDIFADLSETLRLLKSDYLDLYLVHWPNSLVPIAETLGAMEELRQSKKIRHIGLSNVNVNHLKKALTLGIPISWVQVEMHPFFYDPLLVNFCVDHGIGVQAWRPLDLGRLQNDKLLTSLGKTHNKTPCQIALRWIIQNGCVPVPGSKNPLHLSENFMVSDFSLSEQEMALINQRAASGQRYRITLEHGLGFADEFDFSYEECWPSI